MKKLIIPHVYLDLTNQQVINGGFRGPNTAIQQNQNVFFLPVQQSNNTDEPLILTPVNGALSDNTPSGTNTVIPSNSNDTSNTNQINTSNTDSSQNGGKKNIPPQVQLQLVVNDPQSIKKIKNPTQQAIQQAVVGGVSASDLPDQTDTRNGDGNITDSGQTQNDPSNDGGLDDNITSSTLDTDDNTISTTKSMGGKTLPPQVQLQLVVNNPKAIRDIKNPTTEAMLQAVVGGATIDDLPDSTQT